MEPLMPHLLDIASSTESRSLILAGGFGIRLKQEHLRRSNSRTLIPVYPEARATEDLDFFLKMELFQQAGEIAGVRTLLDSLGYETVNKDWKFRKPLGAPYTDRMVDVDLLARHPTLDEAVKVKSPRVGSGAGIGLHGHETPEAFAVEDQPVEVGVEGQRRDGTFVSTSVQVPHPYAWINMKVKAAHDWLEARNGPRRPKLGIEKHVLDVYLLTAMLTEQEIREAEGLAERYATHPIAQEIREYAKELYANPTAPGFVEVARQTDVALDHDTFWEALCAVLGIATPAPNSSTGSR
jgi:hypothetical protein